MIETSVVTRLAGDNAVPSLIVHAFPSYAEATAYHNALCDVGYSLDLFDPFESIERDGWHFTLVRRMNKPHWPAPLIFYIVDEVSDPNAVGGTNDWVMAVLSDGTVQRIDDLMDD